MSVCYIQNQVIYTDILLTLKAPCKFAADDILNFILFFFQRKKDDIRVNPLSCSVKIMMPKKIKMTASAAVVINALKV